MDFLKKKLKAAAYHLGPKYKKSFSQCGEDIILARACKALGIVKPFYLDIGANDPIRLSNTYSFYLAGSRGICVEPNPALAQSIRNKRPNDACIEAGVGARNGTSRYFMFKNHVLNTFSEKEAKETEKLGHPIEKTVEVPIITVEKLLKDQSVQEIDILSLDIEGLDLEILQSMSFTDARPKIICVETKGFGDSLIHTNTSPIAEFLKGKNYAPVAGTLINTIFVDGNLRTPHVKA